MLSVDDFMMKFVRQNLEAYIFCKLMVYVWTKYSIWEPALNDVTALGGGSGKLSA